MVDDKDVVEDSEEAEDNPVLVVIITDDWCELLLLLFGWWWWWCSSPLLLPPSEDRCCWSEGGDSGLLFHSRPEVGNSQFTILSTVEAEMEVTAATGVEISSISTLFFHLWFSKRFLMLPFSWKYTTMFTCKYLPQWRRKERSCLNNLSCPPESQIMLIGEYRVTHLHKLFLCHTLPSLDKHLRSLLFGNRFQQVLA